MCGIAGLVGFEARDPARLDSIQAMVGALRRRGPDSEGIESWPGAVFGHRRLAILDLSPAGHQPMLAEDGQLGVVFNGCIYNFLSLREELKSSYDFRSECDTEVLLAGYRRWGIDELVRRLQGMFAFAIWDNRERTLAIARDRLGVKPLLYSFDRGGMAFASTARALKAGGFGGDLDPEAVLEYLEFGFVTDQRAIYRDIHKLPAGSLLVWKDGRVEQRSYWSLPEPAPESKVTFEDAVAQTESLLIEAVRLRLQADVPVGALLSGGVDSALVCWALAQLQAGVKAFTVSTPGDPADETAAAADTARRLGVPHQTVDLGGSEDASLEELIEAYSEPFGCSSALGMLRVSRAVKPYATVLLTGDGGDDVFLGYRHHPILLKAQRAAGLMPDFFAPLWSAVSPVAGKVGPLRRAAHFLDYATEGMGAVTRVHDGFPYFDERRMRGERLQGFTLRQRLLPPSVESARRLLLDDLRYEQDTRFVAEFMTKVDGGAMHYALEARSPFLDQEVWEFAARLPLDLRLHHGQKKAVLREIVRRRVGDEVATRKKQGFTIPVERWLARQWQPTLRDVASDSLLEREGWLSPGSLKRATEEAFSRQQMPTQLWYLVVLDRWMRHEADARRQVTAPALAN